MEEIEGTEECSEAEREEIKREGQRSLMQAINAIKGCGTLNEEGKRALVAAEAAYVEFGKPWDEMDRGILLRAVVILGALKEQIEQEGINAIYQE